MKKLWSVVSAVFVTLITSSLALAAAEGVAATSADSQVKAAIAIAAKFGASRSAGFVRLCYRISSAG